MPVVELLGAAPELEAVRLRDGRILLLAALFTAPKLGMASPLADQLGCAFDEGPLGPAIRVDGWKRTTVPGVYAAGDAASWMHDATLAKVFVEERENADTADRPGLAVRRADDPFPFWNMIFLAEREIGPQHLAQRLEQAASCMRESGHAGFVPVWQDRLDDAARADLPDPPRGRGSRSR